MSSCSFSVGDQVQVFVGGEWETNLGTVEAVHKPVPLKHTVPHEGDTTFDVRVSDTCDGFVVKGKTLAEVRPWEGPLPQSFELMIETSKQREEDEAAFLATMPQDYSNSCKDLWRKSQHSRIVMIFTTLVGGLLLFGSIGVLVYFAECDANDCRIQQTYKCDTGVQGAVVEENPDRGCSRNNNAQIHMCVLNNTSCVNEDTGEKKTLDAKVAMLGNYKPYCGGPADKVQEEVCSKHWKPNTVAMVS